MPDCEFQLTFLFLHFPLFLIEFKIDYINMYETTFPVECLSKETSSLNDFIYVKLLLQL